MLSKHPERKVDDAWMADHNVEEGRLYVPHPDHSDRSLCYAAGGLEDAGIVRLFTCDETC